MMEMGLPARFQSYNNHGGWRESYDTNGPNISVVFTKYEFGFKSPEKDLIKMSEVITFITGLI
jgi:hypothetical protein